jgi:hypothetical protein
MTALFRASNELRLEADGELTEVTFNVPFFELLNSGWTWLDFHHFSNNRVVCCQDGALILQMDYLHELLLNSIHLTRLFSFSWTQMDNDMPRELLLCFRPDTTALTFGNYEIAETFSGILALFLMSPVKINLTVRSLIETWSLSHLPLFAFDENLRDTRPLEHQGNLQEVAFHNFTFEGRAYRNLMGYLCGIQSFHLDSVLLNDDDFVDLIAQLHQLDELINFRIVYTHRPARRQEDNATHRRLSALLDLVRDSKIETISINRQHRDKKLYAAIQRCLKLNQIRKWQKRSKKLAISYSAEGFTPPIVEALARVSHDLDFIICMVKDNAGALSWCKPETLEEEQASLEANQKELQLLRKHLFASNKSSEDPVLNNRVDETEGKDHDLESTADAHLALPLASVDGKDLFYSIARDILGDD